MPIDKSSLDSCMSDFKKEFPTGRKKKKKKMSKKDINAQRYAACNSMVKEDTDMKTLVIYPGRFHPWHKGHKSVYDALVNKFGADSVYIASSNKQAPVSSPFSFEDKKKMMQLTGVPADKIVQVKSPYNPVEITSKVDKDNTAIVFALSAKDAERFTFKPKKDGSPSYMQPFQDDLQPLSQSGYVLVAPTIDFSVLGKPVKSASEVRGMYIKSNDKGRIHILKGLYGKATPELKALFDKELAITETIFTLMKNTSTLLTEGKEYLRKKTIIAKARMLENKIAEEEFNFKR